MGTNTITASYSGNSNFAPSATGTIVTAVGDDTAGYEGDNGPATAAELDAPFGIAFDSLGDLFIADQDSNVVREVVKSTGDIINFAGNGTAGYSGDGGPATAAELDGPRDLAFDSAGDLFISDTNNSVVREVVKATGEIITFAGDGTAGYSGDGGPATAAEVDSPRSLAFDSAGDLFIADQDSNVVREVVKSTGDIITVAGDGTAGYSGNDGPATAAELNGPIGLVFDSAGDLIIADSGNSMIREVVEATGDIIAVAGNGTAGYSGDGGPATAAELDGPGGVAFDSAGDLFIADEINNVVWEVVKATGDIITVAGNGTAGYSGNSGPATAAELDYPTRVAVDSAGDLFVADTDNNVVREITPAVTVTISQNPASQIAITSPALTLIAGSRGQVTVQLEDINGNPSTSSSAQTISLSTTSTGGAFYATQVSTTPITSVVIPAGESSVSFYYSDTKAGAFESEGLRQRPQLRAHPGGNDQPGAASNLVVKRPPSGIVAGIGFGLEVDGMDAYNNLATSFGGSVTVGLANGSGGTLTGTTTVNAVAGVATFTNLFSNSSGSVSLSASSDTGGTNLSSPPTGSIPVTPAPADHFVVTSTFADPDVAGTVGTLTVTAEDQFGNVAGSGTNQYERTVDFDNSDVLATGVPTSYSFTAADAGSHTFTNVILEAAGTQTITATDSVDNTITGATTVNVVPAAVNDFVVTTTFANPDVAGTVGTVVVTAQDAYGNTDGSGPDQYLGTVELTTTDSQAAGLPASHVFTTVDAGSYTFASVVLKTAGAQTITATDSVNHTITEGVSVNVVPAAAQDLVVTTNFSISDVAGTAGTVTVTAEDAYNNRVSAGPNQYSGKVNLSDTDSLATGLPSSYTFTAGDAGSHTFSSVVMKKAGMQSITATDPVNNTIAGTTTVEVVPAAVNDFVVTTTFANPDVAGTVGTVVVTAVDAYGNTVGTGPNAYEGTAKLTSTDSQAAGLPASHVFTASDAGSFTFVGVALKTAGSQTITATDSVRTSVVGTSTVNVTAGPVSHLVLTTPPPNPIVAGQSFTLGVSGEDAYGNVVPTFSRSVTISLPGDTGFTTTVQANNGVATFTGLVVNTTAVQGESITATSGAIKSPPSIPVTVLPPPVPQAPTVISEQSGKIQLFNNKGKKSGKPAYGFALRFSTTMNSSTAGLPANYHVYSTFIKKAKKTTHTSLKPVGFTSSYNPATNTVTLEVKSTQPFAKAGGEITISGVTDQAGTLLDASDTVFIIGKNGKSVGPL